VDDAERTELEQRLVEVQERLDRIGLRLATGYGSDSDRDGWLLWLQQLRAQRVTLRTRLGYEDARTEPQTATRGPARARGAGMTRRRLLRTPR
jgi:hypothetical protein